MPGKTWCRPCKREYDRDYYSNRTDRQKERKLQLVNIRKEKIKGYIVEYLSAHPCELCGYDNIRALDFDHIDPKDKKLNICDMVRHGYAIEMIKKEIEKCRVLCANCHRIRTSEQFGWFKDRIIPRRPISNGI